VFLWEVRGQNFKAAAQMLVQEWPLVVVWHCQQQQQADYRGMVQ
jgi:hypothetical protein